MRFSTLAALAALPAAVCAQPADLVLRNGKIVTMNTAQPVVQALAVRAGRITALGSDTDAARWIGPATKIIDLHGHLATPGLIEGHGHFTGIGEFRLGLDLREARTWDDIVAQVARAASHAKPGEWIIGRGWHQSKWDRPPDPNVEGFPLHASSAAASFLKYFHGLRGFSVEVASAQPASSRHCVGSSEFPPLREARSHS
jgi:hypothetical protein